MIVQKIKMTFPLLLLFFLVLACGNSVDQSLITELPPTVTATETLISISPTSTINIPTKTPEVITTPTPVSFGNATVNVETANLRLGPGTTFGVVASSKLNDVLPIYGKDQNSEWIIINLEDELWISTIIVDLDVDINTIPNYEIELSVSPTVEIIIEVPEDSNSEVQSNTENNNNMVFEDQIELLSYSTYYDSLGNFIVVGEVKNIGEKALKWIDVTITIRDGDGNLLDFNSSHVDTPWGNNLWNTGVLYPNEYAPFRVSFDDAGKWVELIPSIEFDEASERDIAKHYRDITILNHTGRSINDFLFNYQISGELENSGDLSSGDVWFIATLYDNQGNVVGLGESLTDFDLLNPRDIKPFKIEIYARGNVDSYKLNYYAIKK